MKKYKLVLIICVSVFVVLLLIFGIYKIFFEIEEYVYPGIKYELTEEIAMQIGIIILIDAFPEVLNEETQFRIVDKGDSWEIWNFIEVQFSEEGFPMIQNGGGFSVDIKKSNGEILMLRFHD